MLRTWRNVNFRIKHQLYLRILPVVVLTVLAVGLFSGRLLTSRAVNTYIEQKSEQQTALLRRVQDEISLQALALEARREDIQRCFASLAGDGGETDRRLVGDLLEMDSVCGAILTSAGLAFRRDGTRLILESHLDTPGNRTHLERWHQKQWAAVFGCDWLDMATGISWSDGPRFGTIDSHHEIWVFDPIQLAARTGHELDVWQQEASPRTIPVLPVIVIATRPWLNPGLMAREQAWEGVEVVLLLDLAELLAPVVEGADGEDDVALVMDRHGLLVQSSADSLATGLDLTAPGQEVVSGVTGTELAGFLAEAGKGGAHAYLGSGWNPYVFTLTQSAELPLLFVSALPFSAMHGGMVLYTAIIVVMAVIALLGSILAITTVGERLSSRMQAMSAHMAEVARGDYSRRMSVQHADEVGQLVSYFNMMAEGLNEAHEQLREKTNRLRTALAEMKRLDKAKDDFLALISHEVRTPLTSIMGGVEFFKMILPTASEEDQAVLRRLNLLEITEIIESSGQRLSDFMNDAIMMTALQSSDIRVDFSPVPLSDVCELVISGLQDRIAEKRLRVDNALKHEGCLIALCDRELMVTAFEKLLRNAVQHNEPGGLVRIREVREIPGQGGVDAILPADEREDLLHKRSFTSWCDEEIRWHIVEIHNTGPFIPEERREALFVKFELVGKIEHHQKGSGLSLPIVRAVLENHGGRIYVHSREGDGNDFYLVIPCLEALCMPPDEAASGDQVRQGVGGAAGHEEVDLVADGAGLEVELEHAGAGAPRDGH